MERLRRRQSLLNVHSDGLQLVQIHPGCTACWLDEGPNHLWPLRRGHTSQAAGSQGPNAGEGCGTVPHRGSSSNDRSPDPAAQQQSERGEENTVSEEKIFPATSTPATQAEVPQLRPHGPHEVTMSGDRKNLQWLQIRRTFPVNVSWQEDCEEICPDRTHQTAQSFVGCSGYRGVVSPARDGDFAKHALLDTGHRQWRRRDWATTPYMHWRVHWELGPRQRRRPSGWRFETPTRWEDQCHAFGWCKTACHHHRRLRRPDGRIAFSTYLACTWIVATWLAKTSREGECQPHGRQDQRD